MSKPLNVSFASIKSLIEKEELAAASRYMARRKFYESFRSFNLSNSSTPLGEGYFVLAKLAFAYSCLEILESLIGEGRRITVTDNQFSAALAAGSFDRLVSHLCAVADEQKKKRAKDENAIDSEMAKFTAESKPRNLRPLVMHVRHLVFHATVTPSTVGLNNSPRRRDLLLGLANSIVLACDTEFEAWKTRCHKGKR